MMKGCSCTKCLCGNDAVATAYLPIGNIYAGVKEITGPNQVCAYHAQKAKDKGYRVEYY
jgi:hypothetical protein